jgi:hypothetical protein
VPEVLPHFLPDDWKGGFLLLVIVFVLSSFLDNIAAALIGGTMAAGVFRKKVAHRYIAAIVAASNAGGRRQRGGRIPPSHHDVDRRREPRSRYSTPMSPRSVALIVLCNPCRDPAAALFADHQGRDAGVRVDWPRVAIVAFILLTAVVVNVLVNVKYSELSDPLPLHRAGVWAAILLAALLAPAGVVAAPGGVQGQRVPASRSSCAPR